MTERTDYAITHPLNSASGVDMTPYQRTDPQRDGNLLLSILAVDR